ncbi:MAG: hypothetical protein IT580_23545 [Verrucomicrobiales bacterium]|nr:hypothetical protein [Verrucomicrobiales bacterium]
MRPDLASPPPTPSLLVSLGQSPAIVPEAFLLDGVVFGAVHVITSENPEVGLVREFMALHAPNVVLTVTRVADFHDLRCQADHARFEEVLYRWMLDCAPLPEDRYVCLAGGFKTMSAAMQKAAAVLGAAEVFHVLVDPISPEPGGKPRPPASVDEILAVWKGRRLRWIRLGKESGWPQFRSITSAEYPLEIVSLDQSERRVRKPDDRFRRQVQRVVERSHQIARAWNDLADLPFAELATWSEADLAWVRGAVQPDAASDQAWIAMLPKLELHCHLGGFATEGELLEAVRAAAEDPTRLPSLRRRRRVSGWPRPAKPVGLKVYCRLGNNNGTALLRDRGCLLQQCRLLYAHFLDQRVVYAEVRCSPANYADPNRERSPWEVLGDIRNAFNEEMSQARARHRSDPTAPRPCHVNLLIIGTRQSEGDFRAGISRHLSLAVTAAEHWRDEEQCRVVGVDLAGFEDASTRAHYFREEFTAIHRCGLALTVHAGENDDAEGIWRAVFDLNARRLGHALHLGKSPDLLRSVADRGIGVEMCPYANLQIKGFSLPGVTGEPSQKMESYPLLAYLRSGIKVTVNTDNPGISAASLGDNLLLAARLSQGLTRMDILWLQRHALDTAFMSAELRRRCVMDFASALPLPPTNAA